MEQTNIINSKQQPHNLKKILTSAYFGNTPERGAKKCKKKRCQICHLLIEGNSFKFKNNPIPFRINRSLTCDSSNVIYVIRCENCLEEYIGCTNSLRNRTALHKNHINNEANRKQFVSKHIFECGKKFQIAPIYQNHDYKSLLLREKRFISTYNPSLNNNEKPSEDSSF